MKQITIYFFLVVLISISCKENQEFDQEILFSEYRDESSSIIVDTIMVQPKELMGAGIFQIQGDQLVYVDQQKIKLSRFDTTGVFLKEALGRDEGPSGVLGMDYFIPVNAEAYFIVKDVMVYFFPNDEGWTSYSIMDFSSNKSAEELWNNPHPNDSEIYGPNWGALFTTFYSQKDSMLYFPVLTEHPLLNPFEHLKFYEESRVLAKLDGLSGRLVELGGSWPAVYQEQAFIPNLASCDVIVSNNELLVNFRADSLIHVYDLNFKLLYKFGRKGDGFKTSFIRYEPGTDAFDAWEYDLKANSVYASIYADDAYVFRVGLPNGMDQKGSLQIYDRSDYALIAELEVPARCKVIGRIGRYYYADGIVDEEQDRLGVLKFLLP